MRIAIAQISSGFDPPANLELVGAAADDAVARGAVMLVLPEATMQCFGGDPARVAEPIDGPWASSVRRLAKDRGITIAVGMFTPATDGRAANTLLVTGPGIDASYDKIHLFDAFGYRESDTVAPGSHPLIVEIDGVKVGFATCYDIRFPALFTTLARRGAQIIVVSASWSAGAGKAEQWDLLVRARAVDSTCFVVACDQADPETAGRPAPPSVPSGIGRSTVVSPLGEVVASLSDSVDMLVTDIDPADVERARRSLPVLANARRFS